MSSGWVSTTAGNRSSNTCARAPGLEQRLIGGVLNERVLETVGRVGRDATAKHELGADQLIEPDFQLLLRPVGDCCDEFGGELAADHRADLGAFLDRRPTGEPR